MRGRPFVAAMTLLVVASIPRRADADAANATWSLGWARAPGAETCPAAPAVAAAVDGHTGRSSFLPAGQAKSHIEAVIEPHAPGWRAILRIVDAQGVTQGLRELVHADSCAELADEVALVVALLVDGSADSSPASLAPPLSTRRQSLPAPRVVTRLAVIEDHPRRAWQPPPSTTYRMDAGVAVLAGLLPAASAGVVVRAGARPPGFAGIAFDAGFWPEGSVAATTGKAAHFTAAYGGLSLCPLWLERGRLATSACAGLQAGTLVARGSGFDVDSSGARWLAQASGTLDGSLRLVGPAAIWAGTGLGIPFVRDEFFARDAEGAVQPLHQPAAVTGWVGAGLRVSPAK